MVDGKGKSKQAKLLDRFLKSKPEFKTYKFEMATDLHQRLDALKKSTGMTSEAVNEAMNYAVRNLLTRLEREARGAVK